MSTAQIKKIDARKKEKKDKELNRYLPKSIPYLREPFFKCEKVINVVFVGRTGDGKSMSANILTDSGTFHSTHSGESVTKCIQSVELKIGQTTVR